jgi:hypothetical protein
MVHLDYSIWGKHNGEDAIQSQIARMFYEADLNPQAEIRIGTRLS